MLFSSIPFLFYFLPAVLVLYYLLAFSRFLQNLLLLAASLIFYAWGEPVNVLLMLGSIAFNSAFGYLVQARSLSGKVRLALTWVAAICNLAMLFVFKYLTFAVTGLLGLEMPFTVALPIGISFFTFQAMSYVIDVYKGKVRAENPFYVGLYISFFPQLIAGPIVQFSSISAQLRERRTTFDMFALGVCRFSAGLGKKVLLSNCFAAIADNVFGWAAIGVERMSVPAMLAWLGSVAYTLQIYFDFSAYSDMAIGLGLCFGFRFDENFDYPYIADSVVDFWRRWHISLTNWFREYVYFPLGGSRVRNQDLMVRNLLVVWLLTGIWHGANWTFLFWGLYYFVLQLAERFFKYPDKMPKRWMRHVYTMLAVNMGWVVFRADNLYQAGIYFLDMFGLNSNGFFSPLAVSLIQENWLFLLLGVLFCTPIARSVNEYLFNNKKSVLNKIYGVAYPAAMLAMLFVCVCYLASGSYNPFIYFNF